MTRLKPAAKQLYIDLLGHVKLRPLQGRRALLFHLSAFPYH